MTQSQDRIRSVVPDVYYRLFDLILDHGEGCYVYDEDGRRWLDFSSGIAVTSTGHAHPRVVEAVREQAGKFLHCQLNVGVHAPAMELMQRLSDLVGDGYQCFLGNTGSEAVEGAMKLARLVTGRPGFIAFEGGFHGRTAGALSVTSSRVTWRAGYEPLLPSVFFAPYCYPLRSPYCSTGSSGHCDLGCLDRFEDLFVKFVDPDQVAGVIVEPILGEGGYVVPSPGFLSRLRELCDRHGMLLIVDEVQSGMGRTGRMFAFEHEGISPDVVCISKGIASGLPLSAVVARGELMEAWRPGANGGTFNGNVLSCAAANATLDVIEEEGLLERATTLGKHAMDRLSVLAAEYPFIAEVRGRGLMIGMEVVGEGREPDPGMTKAIRNRCFEEGLLLISCGSYGNVIRFIPPLITTEEEVDEACRIIEASFESLSA